jgi:hypothetical protein
MEKKPLMILLTTVFVGGGVAAYFVTPAPLVSGLWAFYLPLAFWLLLILAVVWRGVPDSKRGPMSSYIIVVLCMMLITRDWFDLWSSLAGAILLALILLWAAFWPRPNQEV